MGLAAGTIDLIHNCLNAYTHINTRMNKHTTNTHNTLSVDRPASANKLCDLLGLACWRA